MRENQERIDLLMNINNHLYDANISVKRLEDCSFIENILNVIVNLIDEKLKKEFK